LKHSPNQSPFANIAHNCIVFGRVLRRSGLSGQTDRVLLFGRALEEIGLGSKADVKAAGRAVFVRTRRERDRFDVIFEAFWSHAQAPVFQESTAAGPDEPPSTTARTRSQSADELREDSQPVSPSAPQLPMPVHSGMTSLERASTGNGDRSFTYSFTEALAQKDFSRLNQDEAALGRALIRRNELELGRRRSRQMEAGGSGGNFDARRTLRSGMRRYGEFLTISRRVPKIKRRDIVLLCDISGSMDRYSRLLLQFVHAIRHATGKVEAFVFGTRLTRITRQIRHRDIDRALDDVAANVVDWGGGTRIGDCLRQLNCQWARRVLTRGPIVIIISDGWDRGDLDLLAREMQRLQRSSYRLIWLNPLLGGRNVRPQTVGMKAALPYIDDFLAAHDLKSLTQLIVALRGVDRRRPARPQGALLTA